MANRNHQEWFFALDLFELFNVVFCILLLTLVADLPVLLLCFDSAHDERSDHRSWWQVVSRAGQHVGD